MRDWDGNSNPLGLGSAILPPSTMLPLVAVSADLAVCGDNTPELEVLNYASNTSPSNPRI